MKEKDDDIALPGMVSKPEKTPNLPNSVIRHGQAFILSFNPEIVWSAVLPILFAGTAHHFKGSDLHIPVLSVLFLHTSTCGSIFGFLFHVMHCDVRDDTFDSYCVSHMISQGNPVAFQVPSATVFATSTNSFVLSPLAKQPVTVLSADLDLPLLVVSWAEDPTEISRFRHRPFNPWK
jgi:hypothetical protein